MPSAIGLPKYGRIGQKTPLAEHGSGRNVRGVCTCHRPWKDGTCRWAPGTCFVKDVLFCVEGHGKVAGIGDLDDVGSDVTKHNVAEVQDVLWQLDPETVRGMPWSLVTFKPGRLLFTKGESVCSLLCAALLTNLLIYLFIFVVESG